MTVFAPRPRFANICWDPESADDESGQGYGVAMGQDVPVAAMDLVGRLGPCLSREAGHNAV